MAFDVNWDQVWGDVGAQVSLSISQGVPAAVDAELKRMTAPPGQGGGVGVSVDQGEHREQGRTNTGGALDNVNPMLLLGALVALALVFK